MFKFKRIAFLTLFSLPLFGCSAPESVSSEEHSDSQIYGPSYAKILASMNQLEKKYQSFVQVIKYGSSLEGRDLTVVKIDLKSQETSSKRPAVLITGATHGNEYLNIVDRLPQWFAENHADNVGVSRYLKAGGVLYIVPIFNPDGYENRTRENAGKQDLNRDFDIIPTRSAKFVHAETATFTRFLDQELRQDQLQLKLTMDYHCCMGALVYPWGYTKKSLEPEALSKHVEVANTMRKMLDPTYASGATYELLGYLSEGSSKDYYYAKYGALAFTFEGKVRDESLNFKRHSAWWDVLLGGIANSAED